MIMTAAQWPVASPELSTAPLTVEVIDDAGRFAELRDEWNELLACSRADCLFLTWEWLYTWWIHLGLQRRLFIVIVRSGSKLLAIAPLTRSRAWAGQFGVPMLEFAGTGTVGSDYLDFIVHSAHETTAGNALVRFLAEAGISLRLPSVKEDSIVATLTTPMLVEQGWHLRRVPMEVCPFIDLSDSSWDSYLGTLGSRHRYNFRRRLRNLEKSHAVHLELIDSEDARQRALSHVVDLHLRRWNHRGGSDAFQNDRLRAFHDEFSALAHEQGWLRMLILAVDEEPAAAFYGFRYRERFLFYQSGFNEAFLRQSIGLVMMGLTIKGAIEEGAAEYDLLHGDEAYKFLWASRVRPLLRIELYAPGAIGRMHRSAVGAFAVTKQLLKSSLKRDVRPGMARAENSSKRKNGHERTRKLPFDALVLDAALRQSLVTIRSLGRRGRSVAALETHGNVPAFSSRWCERKFVCRTGHATDVYLTYLEKLLESSGARVLISSHDGTIALLRRYRARLERKVRIALANEPALSVAVNKERTMAVANRLGICVPASVIVSSVDDVSLALKEIGGLPVVVKPNESWIGDEKRGIRVNSQLVTTVDEARRAVAELTRFGASALFQRLLSGRREAVSLMYANGEIHARFAQWAKRTIPPLGGESVLRQSIPVPPDIGTQSERLIREIDLDGYSEVEFRRDSAGVPYLMEINPRLSASVEIAVRSGVDFPHLVYQWALGEPIDRIKNYRVGGWMRHLKGDIMTTIATLHQQGRPGITQPTQAVLGFSSSFFKPMAYDYLDWGDPLPAVRASAGFAFYALQRLFRSHA
jgi:CelD/BcsL family acetyltransferase involved in cellulose biosynthesis/predicted ATP-grasp superfamily ATP-dependent carboligase